MATCTVPIPITDKILTAQSAGEPSVGEKVWVSTETYNTDDKVIIGAPSKTVTISIASPGVVTWALNGLPNGAPVLLTTTGALPDGLEPDTIYYVVNRMEGTFQLSETQGGPPIVTTGVQSGVHTATAYIHTVFVSQIDNNIGNPPALDLEGAKWFALGPTNLWSMVDLYRPTVTWAASPFTFTLTPGQQVQSIFLGTLTADQVEIVYKVDGVVKRTITRSLYTRQTFTPLEFCFKPWMRRREIQIIDLPLYPNPVIEVTLVNSAGKVGVGELVLGNPEYLGKTQYGASSKVRNFTKFDRRSDGTLIPPVRQRNVPTGAWSIMFEKENTQNLIDLRDRVNGQICVWSAIDDDAHPYFPAAIILGLATTLDLDLTHPNHGMMSLVAEEN